MFSALNRLRLLGKNRFPSNIPLSENWLYPSITKEFCKGGLFVRFYGTSKDPISLIRNVGIVAHVDAGKTTTTERMLYYSGFIKKVGEVDTGDTVMDYLPAERERGITINSSAITFGWKENQINLIDTPGHVDFTIEVERAIRVLDGCVTILDGVSGVQAQTLNVWRQSQKYKLPKVIFINKLDREGVFLDRSLAEIIVKLGTRPLILQQPIFSADYVKQSQPAKDHIDKILNKAGFIREDNENLPLFLIDHVSMNLLCFNTSKGTLNNMHREKILEPKSVDDPCKYLWDKAIEARSDLLEILGETDQTFLDLFFSDEIDGNAELVAESDIKAAIRRQTLLGNVSPVLFGASYKNYGVQPVLDSITDYLPSPLDRPLPLGNLDHIGNGSSTRKHKKQHSSSKALGLMNELASIEDGKSSEVPLDPNAPLVAFAFKVIVDPTKGPMIYVKVYSGTLSSRSTVINSSNNGYKERVNKLLQMYSDFPEEVDSISCGNIGVILGCKKTRTGDTLLGTNHESLVNMKAHSKKSSNRVTNEEDVFESKDFLGDANSSESQLANMVFNSVGLYLHGINIPPPVFFCSIEPDSLTEEKYLKTCITNMMLEDPSLVASTSTESGQLLLSGMGELHLEVVINRLLKELKVKAIVGKMRVSYRETLGETIVESYDFEREVLGKNLKFGMELVVEPVSDSENLDFSDDLDNNAKIYDLDNNNYLRIENNLGFQISQDTAGPRSGSTKKSNDRSGSSQNNGAKQEPGNKSDFVDDAILTAASTVIYQGPILGFPLTGLKITARNLKFYGLELSSTAAIRLCTRSAFKSAMKKATTLLMEPVMLVTINTPSEYVGTVISELERARRATVLSFEDSSYQYSDSDNTGSDGFSSASKIQAGLINELKDTILSKDIVCQVPLSSLIGFSSTLRRLTAGSGSFTMRIDGFSPVDDRVKDKIIKEFRGY